VAQAAAFDQRARMPRELTRGDEQVVDARIGEISQGIHNSWCAVTVLNQDGCPARAVPSLRLGPVGELSLANGSDSQCALNAGTPVTLFLRRQEGPSLTMTRDAPRLPTTRGTRLRVGNVRPNVLAGDRRWGRQLNEE
jgi:hypothetical protein